MRIEPLKSAGRLYLVATPIGHLQDVTHRSLQVLAEADMVACEDTRVTARLLARHGLKKKRTIACHEHNEGRQISRLLDILNQGGTVALVSDAGMPLISDPGLRLVQKARLAGHQVVPLPGACAIPVALAASGLPAVPFTFMGFLPARRGPRRKAIENLSSLNHTLVLFESARRLTSTLQDLSTLLGGRRKAAVCREMTKIHEEIVVESLAELTGLFQARPSIRGEITLVIGPVDKDSAAFPVGPATSLPPLDMHFRRLLEQFPGHRKKVIRTLARERGVSRRTIYQALLAAGLMGDGKSVALP